MGKPLAGKVAIVTGGSKGIGEACSVALAADGASVVVNYARDDAVANSVVDGIIQSGGKAVAVRGSVESADDVDALFSATKLQFSQPDILVCNAGVSGICPLTDVTEAEFDRIYNLNVKGLMFLLRAAAHELQDNGRVITIASSTAAAPPLGTTIYASSKAAAIKMSEIAAMELGPRGITVNSVLPGLTETPMIVRMPEKYKRAVADSSPFGRIGKPGDISCVVAFLASAEAQWVTGQSILVNGGAKR